MCHIYGGQTVASRVRQIFGPMSGKQLASNNSLLLSRFVREPSKKCTQCPKDFLPDSESGQFLTLICTNSQIYPGWRQDNSFSGNGDKGRTKASLALISPTYSVKFIMKRLTDVLAFRYHRIE